MRLLTALKAEPDWMVSGLLDLISFQLTYYFTPAANRQHKQARTATFSIFSYLFILSVFAEIS